MYQKERRWKMKIKAWVTRDCEGRIEMWIGDNKPFKEGDIWWTRDLKLFTIGTSDIFEACDEAIEFEIDVPVETLYKRGLDLH